MTYTHTQRAPLQAIFFVLGGALGLGGWLAPTWAGVVLLGVAGLFVVLGLVFGYLRVSDGGDHLRVAFGPLPLFRRLVYYADVRTARQGRSNVMDGWGIHWRPGRGWIWNLWGFECVELELGKGRRLCVGTDDSRALCELLQRRIGA